MIRGSTAILALAFGTCCSMAADSPLRSVKLEVSWGPEGGTESVRQAVERVALQAAASADCVGGISAAEEVDGELLWRVVLVELEEETVYDDSIYGVHVPGEPGKDLARTARIRLDLTSQVSYSNGSGSDKVRSIRIEESRRPRFEGEDTARAIRADVVRRAQRELERALCRGAKRAAKNR